MSYCVNCGVELDSSAKKCALCSTPVYNPNIKINRDEEKPFSEKLQIPKSVKKRFIAFVISVAMLVPNIVMFFLNVFFIRQGFWSLYVFAASLLVWTLFIFPLFTEKIRPFLLWGFDTFAVSLFFVIVFKVRGGYDAVLNSALSTILLVSFSILLIMLWLKTKKRHWTSVVVITLFLATLVSVFSGMATAFFTKSYNFFVVGIVIGICSFVMMLFFVYCNRSKHIRAWLNKVFYI